MKTVYLIISFLFVFSANAQDAPRFTLETISPQISVITGGGGNVGIYHTASGIVVVDSMLDPLQDEMVELIRKVAKGPVRYLINTHWHWDHVGGNKGFAQLGTTIIAHENLRKRMVAKQYLKFFDTSIEPYPAQALPTITYQDEMSIHLGNNEFILKHIPNAHTDGDTLVFIPEFNIIQMGDIYLTNSYPFIDVETGGTIDNMINAWKWALLRSNNKTTIIPGHGKLSNKTELAEYLIMLESLRDKISELKKSGASLDDIMSLNITKEYDSKWNQGFLKKETLISTIYQTAKVS